MSSLGRGGRTIDVAELADGASAEGAASGALGWMEEPMKIVVDRELCETNAVCVRHAPDVFGVNDEEYRLVVLVERPGPDLLAKAKRAVMVCPKRALSLVEDE